MFTRLQAVPNQIPGPGSLAASIMSHSRAQASDLQRQKDALKMTCAGPGVPRQRRAQASENYTSQIRDNLYQMETRSRKSTAIQHPKELFNLKEKTDSILATHRSQRTSDLYTMLGLNLSGSVQAGDPVSGSLAAH